MKKIYTTTALSIYSILAYSQMGYEYTPDEEDVQDFQRYAHLNLSKGEVISIIVGIVLLLIAKNILDTEKESNVGKGLGCAGFICLIPLILVILAVAQKLIGYAIILAIIIGGLYLLFGKK